MLAFLDKNGHNNFRIAARSIAHKPGIVLEAFLLADFIPSGVADHLGAAGLSAELDSLELGARGGPALVDHAPHGLRHFFRGVLRNREVVFAD